MSALAAAPWWPDWIRDAGDRTWCAIDFETDNASRDSACAVALVRVEKGVVVHKAASTIRPPKIKGEFSHIHGITPERMLTALSFREVWPTMASVWEGCAYFVAHNAPFDRSVLQATCAAYGLEPPGQHFEDTVKLAKIVWPGLPSHSLGVVCSHIRFALKHHDAESDALGCAHVVFAARKRITELLGDHEAEDGGIGLKAFQRPSLSEALPVASLPAHILIEGHAIRCLRCGGEVEHWTDERCVLERWTARFASEHPASGECLGRENRALRELHHRDLGMIAAPPLERPVWMPERAPVEPVREAVRAVATAPKMKPRKAAVVAGPSLFDLTNEEEKAS